MKKINYLIILLAFLAPYIVVSFSGLIFTGLLMETMWPVIIFAVLIVILLAFTEIRTRCGHCSLYSEKVETLRGLAEQGSPRFWLYHPKPLNGLEKTIFSVLSLSLAVFPLLCEAYGIWLISADYERFGMYALFGLSAITLATLLTAGTFFVGRSYFLCSDCSNFLCFFNRVPLAIKEEYLRVNRVLKEALENWKNKRVR
jgi:hypothetical protein